MKATVYQNSLVIPRSQITNGDNKNWKLHFPCSCSLLVATFPPRLPSSGQVSWKHVKLRHSSGRYSHRFSFQPPAQHDIVVISWRPAESPAFPLLCLPSTRFLRVGGGDSSGDWVRATRLLAESPLFKGGVEPGEEQGDAAAKPLNNSNVKSHTQILCYLKTDISVILYLKQTLGCHSGVLAFEKGKWQSGIKS